jgi:UDP-2,3-diacylglucosamine hydrolase
MEILAPPTWRCVDFISDLHLQASDTATFDAWRNYLHTTAADAVFILGDLLEVWVGDDVIADAAGFEALCATTIQAATARVPVYIMHGNRDFLMGPALMQACGAALLADPTTLTIFDQRWLLTHGDALCLDDVAYQQFRATVRSTEWQQTFLAQPLAERQKVAHGLREQSETRKREATDYADVDTSAAIALLNACNAKHMIHGHTHRPADHLLAGERKRFVLSDWDLQAHPPRAEIMRLTQGHGKNQLARIAPESASAITPTIAPTIAD